MNKTFRQLSLCSLISLICQPALVQAQDDTSDADWQQPMTSWGVPDLRGTWPIGHVRSVPLVRPEEYGNRLQFTEEEKAARARQVEEQNERYEEAEEEDSISQGHWTETTETPVQTSLIVSPEDGQFPEMTDVGKEMSKGMGSSWYRQYWDKPEDFDSWDRCITRGLPMSVFPAPYNNGIKIHQTPGYVAIQHEMIHETRIVPMDGRPKLDNSIRQWMGSARGHWEGNTLVVETTNFNGKTGLASPIVNGAPSGTFAISEEMRIEERFEMVDDDTINYSITINDPVTQKRPWTVSYPWEREEDYRFFEYACHEDNKAIRSYIVNSREQRRLEEQGKDPGFQSWQQHLQELSQESPDSQE